MGFFGWKKKEEKSESETTESKKHTYTDTMFVAVNWIWTLEPQKLANNYDNNNEKLEIAQRNMQMRCEKCTRDNGNGCCFQARIELFSRFRFVLFLYDDFFFFFSEERFKYLPHSALACLFEHWCVPYVAFKLTTRFHSISYISSSKHTHNYTHTNTHLTTPTAKENPKQWLNNDEWRGRDWERNRHKYKCICYM